MKSMPVLNSLVATPVFGSTRYSGALGMISVFGGDAQPSLVNERSRLQGMSGRLGRHLRPGQAAQILIDHRQELLRGHEVAVMRPLQEIRQFAQGLRLSFFRNASIQSVAFSTG